MLRSNPMVPGCRSIIAIINNHNAHKVPSFIVIDNSGSTYSGIHYLSKYPDRFCNVSIHPVACPLVMYNSFGEVNEFHSYKKPRQSYLALDKFWVNQCSWIRLCMTVSIGMTITN